MITVFVFKTSVETDEEVPCIAPLLNSTTGVLKWNFDL
jgi:hypothetical protein